MCPPSTADRRGPLPIDGRKAVQIWLKSSVWMSRCSTANCPEVASLSMIDPRVKNASPMPLYSATPTSVGYEGRLRAWRIRGECEDNTGIYVSTFGRSRD